MDIKSLKLEIVKHILETESEELLSNLLSTIRSEEKDFYENLTDEQKEEIRISREQIKRGETEDWESVYERLK